MCICIRQWVLLKLQYIRRYIALCEPSRYRLLVFVIKSLVWCFLLFFSPQKFGHRYWHPEFPRRLGSEPASPGFRDLNMESLLVSKTVHLCLNTENTILAQHFAEAWTEYRYFNCGRCKLTLKVFRQVRPAKRHGRAHCWVAGRLRCCLSRTSVAIRVGVCRRGDGLRGGGWHHTWGSSQVRRKRRN